MNKLSREQRSLVIASLVEGASVRSTVRMHHARRTDADWESATSGRPVPKDPRPDLLGRLGETISKVLSLATLLGSGEARLSGSVFEDSQLFRREMAAS